MDAYSGVEHKRYVLTGTCGWTDDTLYRCKRFYPSSAKTAIDRLRHYSRHYPCVEIDTSTYAIPRPHQIKEWMSVVPKGFLFHIKIFGLITSQSIQPGALPRDLRSSHLPIEMEESATIKLSDMPPELISAIWERMNEAIEVLHANNMLGCVVFQFHTNFEPTPSNMQYVADCRAKLSAHFKMAIEFRSRLWYSLSEAAAVLTHSCFPSETAPPVIPAFKSQKAATLYLMRRLNIISVPSDDLLVEMPQHGPMQPSYRDGRVYIYDDVTSPDCVYIRLHRRRGNDRVLSADELKDWNERIQRMAKTADGPFHWPDPTDTDESRKEIPLDAPFSWTRLSGPVFFMVGTGRSCLHIPMFTDTKAAVGASGSVMLIADWEDQPMLNLKGLATHINDHNVTAKPSEDTHAEMFDWKLHVKEVDAKTGIQSFFSRMAASEPHDSPKREAKETLSSSSSVDTAGFVAGKKRARPETVAASPAKDGAKTLRSFWGAGAKTST